jgi:hypothetical protein
VSPHRKRAAAEDLQEKFSVSERRACQALDQPRSSQRYREKPRDDEAALLAMRGVPGHSRSDNGPEFVANALQA